MSIARFLSKGICVEEPSILDCVSGILRVPAGIVSLVGAGGKTSLQRALATQFAADGHRVIVTTTTRMRVPGPEDGYLVTLTDEPVIPDPAPGTIVYQAQPARPGDPPDKVCGVAPETVDAWREARPDALILVEADGAAGRALKAPAAHEPVIPETTAVVVAVIGLGCFGKPMTEKTVFRLEEVSALTGLQRGDIVTPASVLPLLVVPDGLFKNSPVAAKRVVYLNQSDLPGAREAGQELIRLAETLPPRERTVVVMGSLVSRRSSDAT